MKSIFPVLAVFFLFTNALAAQNCQAVVPSAPSVVTDAEGYYDMCLGDTLFLTAAADFPENNTTYAQTTETTDFTWTFDNGIATTGQNAFLVPTQAGGRILYLRAADVMGCDSLITVAKIRISGGVSTEIEVTDVTDICPSEEIITAEAVLTSPFTYHFANAAGNFATQFIPDGTGSPVLSPLVLADVSPLFMTQEHADNLQICLTVEHSWLRDLEISLTCPDGNSVILHDHPGAFGGEVFLGEPEEGDNDDMPAPGTGYQYCWTTNAPNGTWLETVNTNDLSVLPADDYSPFESFDSLIGCPINGTWILQIVDLWSGDNGYLFDWQMSIDGLSFSETDSFTVTVNTSQWLDEGANIAAIEGNTLQFMPLENTAYNFVTEDNFGCADTVTLPVSVLSENNPACAPCVEAEIFLTPDADLDCPSSDYTLSVLNLSEPELYDFLWTTADGNLTGDPTAPTVTTQGGGTYTLAVTRPDGCILTASTTLTAPPPLPVQFSPAATAVVCAGDTVTFTASVPGGGDYDFIWQNENGNYVDYNETLEIGIEDAGTYYVYVTDFADFCVTVDTLETVGSDEIFAAAEISFADCDESNGSISLPNDYGETFTWSNGATGNTITDLAQGFYNVTLTTENCMTEQTFYLDELQDCKALIGGRVYLSPDCTADENTPGVSQILVHLLPDDIYTYTDTAGFYEFYVEPAEGYTVTYTEEDQFDLLCPTQTLTVTGTAAAGDASTENDWFVKKAEVVNLCVDIFTDTARPGFTQDYALIVCNFGCLPTDGTLIFQHDPLVTPNDNFLDLFTTYDAETYTATLETDILVAGECGYYGFAMTVSEAAELSDFMTHTATVGSDFPDLFPENNSITETDVIVGAYDPNDKQNRTGSNPFGSDIFPDDSTMRYQIRFQNTGTDTAYTVLIEDVLDEDLDGTTIRPGASSHAYDLEFKGNDTLVFRFNDILLPDSMTNEAASKGFVNFTIQANADFGLGTQIENTAAIYFDYNEPIITNTVVNTVVDSVSSVRFLPATVTALQVAPNPVGEVLRGSFTLTQSAEVEAYLTDVTGRFTRSVFGQRTLPAGTHNLGAMSVKDLPAGVYFLVLQTDGARAAVKRVKR